MLNLHRGIGSRRGSCGAVERGPLSTWVMTIVQPGSAIAVGNVMLIVGAESQQLPTSLLDTS
jgi:hypothetical protein